MAAFLIILAVIGGMWNLGDQAIKQEPWPESAAKQRMDSDR